MRLDPLMCTEANGRMSRASGGGAAQGVGEMAPPFAESILHGACCCIGLIFRWNLLLQVHVHREVCALYSCEGDDDG